MATFIKGMIVGATVMAAALGGYAFGTSQQQSEIPGWSEPEELASNCQVIVGYGRTAIGDQCRPNQVMVGRRSDYLLCADIQVSCP